MGDITNKLKEKEKHPSQKHEITRIDGVRRNISIQI
jgi:hypothetical protein